MTDKFTDCLEVICNFPIIYKTGNRSPSDIVIQSGYTDLFEQISEDAISKYIDNKSDLVQTWINYTEDIRHNPAWGLQLLGEKEWLVFFMIGGQVKNEFTFDNPSTACAKMIKMTVEAIRRGL